jgi:Flp pilus assembly pilin Flp
MMKNIREKLSALRTLQNNEEGLTTVEYAIVLALIAIVAIGAWTALGTAVSSKAQDAATQIGNG